MHHPDKIYWAIWDFNFEPKHLKIDVTTYSGKKTQEYDNDVFSLSPPRQIVDVPDIGGAAERKTSERQSQLCSTVFKLRPRAPSFNFNTISNLAVQLLKAPHAHES